VIPKGYETRHLKETSLGRKATNLKKKSTKEGAQKPIKIGSPPNLKTRPLLPLGWVFPVVFLLAWELAKQLKV